MERETRIEVGGVAVTIIRKPRLKNIYLRVKPPDGRVVVTSAVHVSDERVRRFVASKLALVRRHQERLAERLRENAREFVSGETHCLWGEPLTLDLVEGERYGAEVRGGTLRLTAPPSSTRAEREKALLLFYRREMARAVPLVVSRCERLTGLRANEVRLRNMRTRWGSCNIVRRRVWLSVQLAKKPPACLEYVVIHELVHLVNRRHDAAFYATVERFCPNWRDLRRKLK